MDDNVQEAADSDEWVDCDSDREDQMKDESQKAKPKDQITEQSEKKEETETKAGQVWDEEKEPLKPDEELDFDSSAYEMLHRSEVEWPCLSLDILVRERCPEPQQDFTFKDWFAN